MPPPLVAARRRPPPSLSPNRSPNLVQRHRAPYAPAATPRRRLPLVPPRPLRQGAHPRVRVLVRALVRVRLLYCPFACEASSQPRRATRTAHSPGLTSPHGHPPLSPLPPPRGVGERTRACRALSVASLCPVLVRPALPLASLGRRLSRPRPSVHLMHSADNTHSANLRSARGGGKCTVTCKKPHSGRTAQRALYLYSRNKPHLIQKGKCKPEIQCTAQGIGRGMITNFRCSGILIRVCAIEFGRGAMKYYVSQRVFLCEDRVYYYTALRGGGCVTE